MSYATPETIPAPSRMQRIVSLIKNMLAVIAALDSAEAITVSEKRRILSGQLRAGTQENTEMSSRIIEYPRQRQHTASDPQTERLAS